MSGPIIRKYGFPNHDRIFGARPIEHGAEEEAAPVADEAMSKAGNQREPEGDQKDSKADRRGGE